MIKNDDYITSIEFIFETPNIIPIIKYKNNNLFQSFSITDKFDITNKFDITDIKNKLNTIIYLKTFNNYKNNNYNIIKSYNKNKLKKLEFHLLYNDISLYNKHNIIYELYNLSIKYIHEFLNNKNLITKSKIISELDLLFKIINITYEDYVINLISKNNKHMHFTVHTIIGVDYKNYFNLIKYLLKDNIYNLQIFNFSYDLANIFIEENNLEFNDKSKILSSIYLSYIIYFSYINSKINTFNYYINELNIDLKKYEKSFILLHLCYNFDMFKNLYDKNEKNKFDNLINIINIKSSLISNLVF
jgi:hypothetical protein